MQRPQHPAGDQHWDAAQLVMQRSKLRALGGLISAAVAALAAAALAERVRPVDVVLLFALGFGAGVSFVAAVRELRRRSG